MGRKKLPEGRAKSGRINVQASPAQKRALEAAAELERADGVSTWLRELGLARARKLGVRAEDFAEE